MRNSRDTAGDSGTFEHRKSASVLEVPCLAHTPLLLAGRSAALSQTLL